MIETTAGEHVPARWALMGKPPGDAGEYRVLAASDREARPGEFDRLIRSLAIGTPDPAKRDGNGALPWAAFAPRPEIGRLALVITDRLGHGDAGFRPTARFRYFDLPLAETTRPHWSYSAFYQAAAARELTPSDSGPALLEFGKSVLMFEAIEQDPERAPVLDWCRHLAGLVLDGPVVITNAPPTRLEARLGVLDAVMAMLPAWTRAEIAISAWAPRAQAPFRLVFSDIPGDGWISVPWLNTPKTGGSYAEGVTRLAARLGTQQTADVLARFPTPVLDPAAGATLERALDDICYLERVGALAGAVRRLAGQQQPQPGELADLAALIDPGGLARWPEPDYAAISELVAANLHRLPPEVLGAWWRGSADLGEANERGFGNRVLQAARDALAGGDAELPARLWRAAALAVHDGPFVAELADWVADGPDTARSSLVTVLLTGGPDRAAELRAAGCLVERDRTLRRLVAAEIDSAWQASGRALAGRVAALVLFLAAPGAAPPWLTWLASLAANPTASRPGAEGPELAECLLALAFGRLLGATDSVLADAFPGFAAHAEDWPGARSAAGPDLGWALLAPLQPGSDARSQAAADVLRVLCGESPEELPDDDKWLGSYLTTYRDRCERAEVGSRRSELLESIADRMLCRFPRKKDLPAPVAETMDWLARQRGAEFRAVAAMIVRNFSDHPALAEGRRRPRKRAGAWWTAFTAVAGWTTLDQALLGLRDEAAEFGPPTGHHDISAALYSLADRMAVASQAGWPTTEVVNDTLSCWPGAVDPALTDRLLDLYPEALHQRGRLRPDAEVLAEQARLAAARPARGTDGEAYRRYRIGRLNDQNASYEALASEYAARIGELQLQLEQTRVRRSRITTDIRLLNELRRDQ